MVSTEITEGVVKKFYESIATDNMEGVVGAMADDIAVILPPNDYNKIIPYIGVFHGLAGAGECGRIRGETTKTLEYRVLDTVVQGNKACVTTFTRASHFRNKVVYEIEDIHHLILNDEGKIREWKIYFDSIVEVAAFKADIDEQLLKAVSGNDLNTARSFLEVGANANTRNPENGLTLLMMASGQANPGMVKLLLRYGADVFISDSAAGGTALHKACQGGSLEVARILVEAGAFVDAVVPTTGHTPLIEALWFKYPDIVEYLLGKGAGLNVNTHYGFTLLEHFNYAMQVNRIGKEKLTRADSMLKARQKADQDKIAAQQLMKAVTDGDPESVKKLLKSGTHTEERYPVLNGFNDNHTPLLVACREGHTEIVRELIEAGADINVTEPTFGAVPLHKATYNGHAGITRILAEQPEIDLNVQGPTNGYTPLHDALWHGFDECSRILIAAGARLDQKGHDGKTPLDIAREVFGDEHAIVKLIQSKTGEMIK